MQSAELEQAGTTFLAELELELEHVRGQIAGLRTRESELDAAKCATERVLGIYHDGTGSGWEGS